MTPEQAEPQTSVTPLQWLDQHSATISAVVGDPTRLNDDEANAVYSRLSELAVSACQGGHIASMETILGYVATAHGLHAAASRLREIGEERRADEVTGLGQIFLAYAAGDVCSVAAFLVAADELNQGETVH
ncbi:MAG TPA: hypothetical protein VGN97_22705 [Mesorhizobium sp.]|nr:hypothetical protein [Mesorhizobium sp.]